MCCIDRLNPQAFADLGDFLKRLPVLPVWVSASENFEGALSTQSCRSRPAEKDDQ
jgi:hypothetical protein